METNLILDEFWRKEDCWYEGMNYTQYPPPLPIERGVTFRCEGCLGSGLINTFASNIALLTATFLFLLTIKLIRIQ